MNYRLAFDQRSDTDDGFGNIKGDWVYKFTLWAGKVYRAGRESVEGGGLKPSQSVTVTIRNDSQSRLITDDWRIRDSRTGEAFNIRSIRPGGDRENVLILETEKDVSV